MVARAFPTRRTLARQVRDEAAELAALRPHPPHIMNGEEVEYRSPTSALSYIANFTKALPHIRVGEVVPSAYRALLRALESTDPDTFEQIPLGTPSGLKLRNPQAGLAFDLQGPDAQGVTIPPAPRIDSQEASGELGELYWMALLRDVSFIDYGTGAGTDAAANNSAAAASDISTYRDFRGPRDPSAPSLPNGLQPVTPATLFRGFTPGDVAGPYISQFMLIGTADPGLALQPQDGFIRYGTLLVDQRQKTVLAVNPSTPARAGGADYLTRYERLPFPAASVPNWLDVQNGVLTFAGTNVNDTNRFDPTRRFISNLRDLANYVHFDALYEAYLNACLILLEVRAPVDAGNPYLEPLGRQDGFGTFGGPHILSLVTEVATRALKSVWYQKWGVHRRLRPEEFGGRVHVHLRGLPARPFPFPAPAEVRGRYPMLNRGLADLGLTTPPTPAIPPVIAPGSILERINQYNINNFGTNTFLLPHVFPEGAPAHPAYGAGHATVAGACVTILKAWFDETFVLPPPYWAADRDGVALVNVTAGSPPLTVAGELNKLAANISVGRNAAGVHWRSDYVESLRLGEQIAIGILKEQKFTYNEIHHFSLTRFDGTAITI